MQATICDAISHHAVLSFRYKSALRIVEPHLLGYDGDGDLTLSAWQISGTGQGWRRFHVSRLRELATTGATFERPRTGYNRNDSKMARIVCRL